MNKRKLSFRLNYIQIAHYIFLIVLIFIISFVLIRKTLINHTHNELNDKFKIASREIDEEFIKVETISDLLIDSYQSETLTKEYATSIKRLISTSSKAISAIYITHNNSDIFSYSQENSPVNHFKIGTNSQDNWLIRNNNEIVFSKTIDDHTILTIYILPSKIISLLKKEMNKEKIFPLLLNGKDKNVLSEQEYESELSDEIVEIINRNIPDKKQIIKTKKGKFYFFSFYYEKPDLYLTLAEPITVINPGMIQYTSILMSILFISIALFVTMVLSSSNRIIKSIEEIVQNIKKSKYLSSDTIVYENEAVLIPKSFDILENRLSLYEKNLEKITSKSQLLEKDLKIAQKLQRNLLPTLMPSLSERKEFSLYAISDSVFDIGGDLFDYFLIDDNHLLVAVADVSGKGIPASLFMIYTHTLLRSIPTPEMNASKIIENLNNKLIEENISDMFVTIFLGILNLSNGVLQYCNAAHCAPLIIGKEGTITEISDIHGIPVGIYPNKKYEQSMINLREEDQLFIFTDGLIDTIDENGLKYSIEVLKYNLMGTWFLNSKEVVEKIKNSIANFRGNIAPEDDLTIMDLKYKPRG